MKVTQTDKAITLQCGCNVDIRVTDDNKGLSVSGVLAFCPKHAAVNDLLATLERANTVLRGVAFASPSSGLLDDIEDVIAKARS